MLGSSYFHPFLALWREWKEYGGFVSKHRKTSIDFITLKSHHYYCKSPFKLLWMDKIFTIFVFSIFFLDNCIKWILRRVLPSMELVRWEQKETLCQKLKDVGSCSWSSKFPINASPTLFHFWSLGQSKIKITS